MSDAELALSSSGLRVLVGRCYSGSASMYVVGYGSVCLCIESSRAGRDPWAWAWRVGSAAGRDRYVTRGFPPMRRDFPGVRGGQLVFFTVCIPRRLHQRLQPLFSGLPSYLIGRADKSIDRRPTCVTVHDLRLL